MPGIYKLSRHKSRSTVTPDVLSGEQDNTAKLTTLPDLSHAGEGIISSPGLTANPSLSLPPDTPFSSLSDGVPSAPFPSGGEAPSSTLPSGATRETFPVSRFIRQAWEIVDDSCGEGAYAVPQISGNDANSLLAFIDKARMEEAREFRQKGYNPQVPEVDPKLVMQLRKTKPLLSTLVHSEIC